MKANINDPSEGTQPNSIEVPLAKPWIDSEEAEAAARVVRSGWLISGPETEAFEKEFAAVVGSKYAIAVNSGSSALLVAQAALEIGVGDEVVVPDMTFISTASSSLYLGACPVFSDITSDDYGMDAVDLEKCLSKKTRAILPVHYAGQSCNLAPIVKEARRLGIAVIEDAAESHLARFEGKYTGTIGDVGIFSFTPSKPMTTGEGGMIVTDREDIAKRARLIRNFGDQAKFEWDLLGFNFRMPEMMSAIGRIQLKKLKESVRKRREIAHRYTDAFKAIRGLVPPFIRKEEDHNFQLYTLRADPECFTINRDGWISELKSRGVGARLYYPTLHDQGVFGSVPKRKGADFKGATHFATTAFSLPIFPTLSERDQGRVIDAVSEVAKKRGR